MEERSLKVLSAVALIAAVLSLIYCIYLQSTLSSEIATLKKELQGVYGKLEDLSSDLEALDSRLLKMNKSFHSLLIAVGRVYYNQSTIKVVKIEEKGLPLKHYHLTINVRIRSWYTTFFDTLIEGNFTFGIFVNGQLIYVSKTYYFHDLRDLNIAFTLCELDVYTYQLQYVALACVAWIGGVNSSSGYIISNPDPAKTFTFTVDVWKTQKITVLGTQP